MAVVSMYVATAPVWFATAAVVAPVRFAMAVVAVVAVLPCVYVVV